jgi:putative dimethyl sulfoxide reductase chaperone
VLAELARYGRYFADLAELRTRAYGLLGSLFLYPGEQEIAGLLAEAAALRRQRDLLDAFPFFPQLCAVVDLVESLTDEARLRLEEEYVELFAIGTSQVPCPPYESSYVDPTGLDRGFVAVEVDRAYAASGAALVSPDELPDHVALELAFLSLLCAEEEQAWRDDRVEQAARCLDRQRAFHDEHLQRWLPTFTRQVGLAAAPTSLYRQAAEAARAFVTHDRDLIHVLAEACA